MGTRYALALAILATACTTPPSDGADAGSMLERCSCGPVCLAVGDEITCGDIPACAGCFPVCPPGRDLVESCEGTPGTLPNETISGCDGPDGLDMPTCYRIRGEG